MNMYLPKWLIISSILVVRIKALNQPPYFIKGGDMWRFSISEDVPIGTTVYKLKAMDPELSELHYSISGQHFIVHKKTGDVILNKKLDREVQDVLEVVISVTDEPFSGIDVNTVSLRRDIQIIDINDNAPVFKNRPYIVPIKEDTKLGSVVYKDILITDEDFDVNSKITLTCVQSDACNIFSLTVEQISKGTYRGLITLSGVVDYESQSSYNLLIKAEDSSLNLKDRLNSTANVAIEILDVQDQAPIFLSTPYSVSVFENLLPGQKVLTVEAKDGDVKNARELIFTIEKDQLNYFQVINNGNGTATIVTSDHKIDRENSYVSQNGGVYTFSIRATEMVDENTPGDSSSEMVTVVIIDVDDNSPVFNNAVFNLDISEDISPGSPLPGFGMTVTDKDTGDNAKFSLSIRSEDKRARNWFSLEPTDGFGKTPVVIRLANNSEFDFDGGVRSIHFWVIASTEEKEEAASSEVIINVIDANDNWPQFSSDKYIFHIPEDTKEGTMVGEISAIDKDSGIYGDVTYALRGFGLDKFEIHQKSGAITLTSKLDYEKQKSYSLTAEAEDGGGKRTVSNIVIVVTDVNDNSPVFEHNEYRRNIREGSLRFQPSFYLKAFDGDDGSNSEVSYIIYSSNSKSLSVNEYTGEIYFVSPASSSETPAGQYELKVKATDHGTPPLSSYVNVYVRVGISGNQRPIFKGTPYNVTIPETTSSNASLLQVKAVDPDGPDELLEFRIVNGADDFSIDRKSGVIRLSEGSMLDADNTKEYRIVVSAIDSGSPIRETSQTNVQVNIADVNNKPPKFDNRNYVLHISDSMTPGKILTQVKATDPDRTHKLEYSILEPMKIIDRKGFSIKNESVDYSSVLKIIKNTGEIILNSSLEKSNINTIIFKVQVKDVKAIVNTELQLDTVELTIYVKTSDDSTPVFTTGGWTKSNPVINIFLEEESPIGSTVTRIEAHDPMTQLPIQRYQATSSIPRQFVLDPIGNVILVERVDYETIQNKTLEFSVDAVLSGSGKRCTAKVVINILDINDHTPKFTLQMYRASVEENTKAGTVVTAVSAVDGDLQTSASGFGTVKYSISGEHSVYFNIDEVSGVIKVSSIKTIDRERDSTLNLTVTATDSGVDQRKSSVMVVIDVIDQNDNAPVFGETYYSAVILENTPVGSSVINVSATDMDVGLAGSVVFEIINHFDTQGMFEVDWKSGEITTAKEITGKGRNEPYNLMIRAQDEGDPILFSDVNVNILVADILRNDGIPVFIHPSLHEVAHVPEDIPISSGVFRVVALDPDDPHTPEGRVKYSLLQHNTDTNPFVLDEDTGWITTSKLLDRELINNYTLIIIAKDMAVVSQQATRSLKVIVSDIDDHLPLFKRSIDEKPLEMWIEEECELGTVVGYAMAYDPDEGVNSDIGYSIIDGNEEKLFSINRRIDNKGEIVVNGRLDIETSSKYLITVKCYKYNTNLKSNNRIYNPQDLSEIQIIINLIDTDDNSLTFKQDDITIGLRMNLPIDSLVATLETFDLDVNAEPAVYGILNTTFTSEKGIKYHNASPFKIDNSSGQIRTSSDVNKYADGFFTIFFTAHNSKNAKALAKMKIFIVRERNLLKFIFSKSPSEVHQSLTELKSDIENVLSLPLTNLHIYDSEYFEKINGDVDFNKASSCFQLLGENLDNKNLEKILKNKSNKLLHEIYQKYDILEIERCGTNLVKGGITWVQISLLTIASLIGLVAFLCSCFLYCSYNKWQRLN